MVMKVKIVKIAIYPLFDGIYLKCDCNYQFTASKNKVSASYTLYMNMLGKGFFLHSSLGLVWFSGYNMRLWIGHLAKLCYQA